MKKSGRWIEDPADREKVLDLAADLAVDGLMGSGYSSGKDTLLKANVAMIVKKLFGEDVEKTVVK